jgi:hypothetical protein
VAELYDRIIGSCTASSSACCATAAIDPPAAESPESRASLSEQQLVVARALDALPRDQREIFNTPPDLPKPVAMAVTLEPDGGVPAPTGDKYLVGLAS